MTLNETELDRLCAGAMVTYTCIMLPKMVRHAPYASAELGKTDWISSYIMYVHTHIRVVNNSLSR